MDLPAAYAPGGNAHSPERALPLPAAHRDSLATALRAVPDPRAKNRVFPCASLLTLVALGLLAGRKQLAEIQRYGQFLTQAQRAQLGWPYKTGTRFRKAPSYTARYNLLTQLDPHAFAQCLSHWLQAHHGTLPRALALDGQYVRDQVLTLCLSEHETAAPAPVPKTLKKEGELTAARRLLPQTELHGALVTAAALYCEPETLRQIVAHGGDFLIQLQANQPTALATASPLLPAPRPLPATAGSTAAGSPSSCWNRWP